LDHFMRLHRRGTVLAFCTVLVALGQATAGALPVPATSHVNDVVFGTVTSGSTPIGGATVTLTAWPNSATLASLPSDADVATRVVATGQTDQFGSYTLAAGLVLPGNYVEPSGTVALEVEVAKDGVAQSHAFSAALRDSDAATSSDTIAVPGRPVEIDFDRAAQTVKDSGTSAPAMNEDGPAPAINSSPTFAMSVSVASNGSPVTPASASTASAGASSSGPLHCGPWHPQNQYLYGVPEHFINLYTWRGAPTTLTEEVGSDHSLGIAVKMIGPSGWSASGSADISTDTSNGADATVTSSMAEYNQVNYRFFLQSCWKPNDDFAGNNKAWRPLGFFALTPQGLETPVRHPSWSACAAYKAAQNVRKDKGSNVTYSAGVDLGFVSVSARASFSAHTRIEFHAAQATYVCGSDNRGPVGAPEAEAESLSTSPRCPMSGSTYVDDLTGGDYQTDPAGQMHPC
jgi:hypothetical protein